MDFSRVDSQAVFFFSPAHLPLCAMSRFLHSETTAICRSFHCSSPFLSPLELRPKVSQILLKDSAEKPSVHPSRASEPVLSLSKERTEERLKSLENIPFMLSLVEAFIGLFSRIIEREDFSAQFPGGKLFEQAFACVRCPSACFF